MYIQKHKTSPQTKSRKISLNMLANPHHLLQMNSSYLYSLHSIGDSKFINLTIKNNIATNSIKSETIIDTIKQLNITRLDQVNDVNDETFAYEVLNNSVSEAYGPMACGKSNSINILFRVASENNLTMGVVTHAKYAREGALSRRNFNCETQPTILRFEKLMDIPHDILKKLKVIAVDEHQFFPDVIEFIVLCKELNIKLLLSGLRYNIFREYFHSKMEQIISQVDFVLEKSAICDFCGKTAQHTMYDDERVYKFHVLGKNKPFILTDGKFKPACTCCMQKHALFKIPTVNMLRLRFLSIAFCKMKCNK